MLRKLLTCLGAACLGLPVALAAQSPIVIGEHVAYSAATPHPYVSFESSRPQRVWSDEITFPGATYIAPHFRHFDLAAGDVVVVRSPDGEQRWTYEGLGRGGLGLEGGFYSSRIKGERAIVELWSDGSQSAYGFEIDHFGRGYNESEIEQMWADGLGELLNLPSPRGGGESICTTDDKENAICYAASEPMIYNRARAVARLFINGSSLCTGWLVGDEGHILTNEHCITSQVAASNTDYEWMAEAVNCADFCPQLGCDGTVEATDGTLVQDSVPLDYALIQVNSATNLPATYGFLQLRADGATLGERLYVAQHPGGRGKEIGVVSTYPGDSGFCRANSLVEPVCDPTSSTPEVGYWCDTEGGSSGSPVIAYSDHRVVALHHCRGAGFCSAGNDPPDDPNRGVPIEAVIADLGANLPNNALGAAEPIFSDGFESGDTSAWANTVP